jgi:hypothetical protein
MRKFVLHVDFLKINKKNPSKELTGRSGQE